MTRLRQSDRADLDSYIRLLATCTGDLTVDQFRERVVQQALWAETIARFLLYAFGTLFMSGLIFGFVFADVLERPFSWVALWTLCLGGLGAVSSMLLHILKLRPQQGQQKPDQLEVIGRIFLGCLFSLVLSLTLFASPLREFSQFVANVAQAPNAGVEILFPFLCGYSIPLVLGVLDKFIQTVEITLGLDEPRAGRRRKRDRL